MKRLKNIFSIFVVMLFMSYYASSTMFSHTHHFEWGSVTHSHPMVPQSGHSHSAAACSVIDSFGAALFFVVTSLLVVTVAVSVYGYSSVRVRTAENRGVLLCGLRAPPVC